MSISEKANDLLNKFGSAQFDFMVWNTPDNLVARDKARQEISNYIAELELELNNTKFHAKALQKLLTERMDEIAELETESERFTARWRQERQDDKWIPVSERLPDNWESVLTIDISKSTRDMVTAFYNPETSLWSTHFSCDLWVTHWMPLPAPPIVYGKEREE